MANVDFKQTTIDMLEINKGLKDQISYADELGKLKNKYNKSNEREKETLSDVLDKTKDIFKNRKSITEEQLNTVDLHKLERKLIAEGLDDQVKFVQKLKEEDRIQKQINRTINAQAKVYNNIGSSIDSFVRMLPGGGFLGDLLGTGDLGKEMSESFRTELSGGGIGEFGKTIGGEFGGGFLNSLFLRGGDGATGTSKGGGLGGGAKSKKAARRFFSGGLKSAFGTTIVFGAAAKLFSISMAQGFQSQSLGQAMKRLFFGGAFEGIRAAFGTGAKAEKGSLVRMIFNKRRFGVSEADQAKILAAQVNISGASQKTALNIQKSLMSSAAMRGVLPEDVMSDLANNTESFAKYAKDGGQNIGEAAIRARELGISLDTVFTISDGILDFQSSIENELKASLLIGRQLNLNEARRLAMAGDMAGLQEEILRQVGSEEDLMRMNAIQRKSLAGALGVTVQQLNKLASGELEVKNSDMKQNTTALQSLTFAMGALALGLGVNLVGRGLNYAGSLIGKGGGFSGQGFGVDQFRKMGLPRQGVKMAELKLGNPDAFKPIGSAAGLGMAARAGQVGIIVAAIAGVTMLVKKLVGSSDETAKNTKKSISGANFISTGIHDRKTDMVMGR
jgi:hypothetical protein